MPAGHLKSDPRSGRQHMVNLPHPLNVAHKCGDGKWIQIAMPRYDFHYPLFMKVIEREDLIDDERFYPQKNLQSHLEEFYKILDAEIGKYTLEELCRRISILVCL